MIKISGRYYNSVLYFVFFLISLSASADTAVQIQDSLTDKQINAMSENREGINDIYFIGFAPYSTEDVFMHEAMYVRNLFDLQFDTTNHSILLVNNSKTMDLLPVATLGNLEKVFQRVGSLINSDEDVVVLYITSHGSKDLGVNLEYEGTIESAQENDYLNAGYLRQLFEKNNIKWKVIFILACYSGGFIDTLKDENTLIITSASSTRPSFGCGHHGDFTQFGEAMFRYRLGHSRNIISSFELARGDVANLEKSMGLKPSEPQIFTGKNIRSYLGVVLKQEPAM